MKKTLACLLVVASTLQMAYAQGGERAVMKGQNSINVYYGLNLLRGFYKNVASSSGSDVKIGGFGPVGLVFEHMVTDGIGLGAEVGYGQTTVSWTEADLFDPTGQIYSYDMKFTLLRAMFRANFHFAKSENFDAYFLLSAGYRHQTYTFTSSDPLWSGSTVGGFIPFGLKPGLGLRYFFTDNIGLHAEFAFGTPMVCGGLSMRF
jgi:outer membrane protein W